MTTRALFINENIGGHATAHLGIRYGLREHPEIDAEFIDLPRPHGLRRLAGARIPGLARFDLDFQPIRAQLLHSAWIARRLRREHPAYDLLHVYTQNAGLFLADELRAKPSVVSTDGTGKQMAYLHFAYTPTRFTGVRARTAHRVERRIFDAATMVVAQSEWTAGSLRADYGVPDERLRVIPFGVIVPESPNLPALPADALPEITWTGQTMPRKGGARLLRVFREHLRGRATRNLITREHVERTVDGYRRAIELVGGG